MEIKILLLEDNPRIRKSYKDLLKDEAQQQDVQLLVEDYGTAEDAVRRLTDEKPEFFDLIMTDINLVSDNDSDRSGLAVARFARLHLAGVALVGLSAIFKNGDLLDTEVELFDKWWSKDEGFNQIDQLVTDTIMRAKNRAAGLNPELNSPPDTYQDYLAQGYIQEFLEVTTENAWVKPVIVWCKTSSEGVEIEACECKALYSWGDTKEDARFHFEALIEDYRNIFDEPAEKFSDDVLAAREIAMAILGVVRKGVKP